MKAEQIADQVKEVLRAYAGFFAPDKLLCNYATHLKLAAVSLFQPDEPYQPRTLFGVPIFVDDSIPDDIVEVVGGRTTAEIYRARDSDWTAGVIADLRGRIEAVETLLAEDSPEGEGGAYFAGMRIAYSRVAKALGIEL